MCTSCVIVYLCSCVNVRVRVHVYACLRVRVWVCAFSVGLCVRMCVRGVAWVTFVRFLRVTELLILNNSPLGPYRFKHYRSHHEVLVNTSYHNVLDLHHIQGNFLTSYFLMLLVE